MNIDLKSDDGNNQEVDNDLPFFKYYFKKVKFPADKYLLIETIKKNNAPVNLITLVNKFDDCVYQSMLDVIKELNKLMEK